MIKILVLSMDNSGIGYYRMNSPYLSIHEDDMDIEYINPCNFNFQLNDHIIKQYNIIIYHKVLPVNENNKEEFYKLIRSNGIKLIYDIDDHWLLHSSHPNYTSWKKNDEKKIIIDQIKNADYLTTTTQIFADILRELNPNVIVLENAINQIEQQWQSNKKVSEKTRFLWGGGITHLQDLRLLTDSVTSMNKELRSQIQLYLCGYDPRLILGNRVVNDDMSKNPWTHIESIFTNSNKWITNSQYHTWLRKIDDNGKMNYGYNDEFKDEFYQRRFTKPVLTYGTMYNEADVAIAPLKSQHFNFVKSQIKVLEAGIHKCPIIASNYGSYTLDVVDGVNGYLIDENNKTGWMEKIKYFNDNPNAVTDMGESLYETVIEKYTLEKINKKRIEFLRSIV